MEISDAVRRLILSNEEGAGEVGSLVLEVAKLKGQVRRLKREIGEQPGGKTMSAQPVLEPIAEPARQTALSAREISFMRTVLAKHFSFPPDEHVKAAFDNLQKFLNGRLVLESFDRDLQFLLRSTETHIQAPYTDHPRGFIDKVSGQYVWTSQVYFPAYDWTTEDAQSEADEESEREKYEVSREHNFLRVFEPPFHPELVQDVLTRVRTRSEAFAQRMIDEGLAKRGLSVEVFGPEHSWYYPGRCVLIVYKEGKHVRNND